VPSAADGELPNASSVPSFPVAEQDGWIWVYIGTNDHPKPAGPPPMFPVPADGSQIRLLRVSLPVNARMDLAVDNFIDPAHVPFIHHGIFRQRHVPKLKEKEFTRLDLGFRTVNHRAVLPNTIVFRMLTPRLAPAKTTIDFLMPGIHVETFEVGARWGAIMVVVTPLTETTTRLDFTMGWNFMRRWPPLAWLAKRLTMKALGQDREIVELQERGFARRPTMNLSSDSDQLAVWYRRLKKYHQDLMDGREKPDHPVPEKTTLRWMT
jgi:phenylpropionate dioxygenase-like ring-hydroxylating dioxygenase large terminal subunit